MSEEIKEVPSLTLEPFAEEATVAPAAAETSPAQPPEEAVLDESNLTEEEREMVKLCAEDNIAMTPYSSLASGRLSKHPGEMSKRFREDDYARLKYDGTAEQDNVIIQRVAKLAKCHNVSMTEVSLAWLLTKVTAPVVGATKLTHIEGAVKAADLKLSEDEIHYLEEPYVPHRLVGVMAQNTAASSREPHVWTAANVKGD